MTAGGSIFTKLFQTTCREAGVIICVQFLEGLSPKIWKGQKSSKFWRDFWQLSTSIANISGTDLHIAESLTKTWSTITPSTLDERNLVNFGPQTKKFYRWILTHRSEHFAGDYISALTGWCALKFLYALEIAYPNWGGGPPPPKEINKI